MSYKGNTTTYNDIYLCMSIYIYIYINIRTYAHIHIYTIYIAPPRGHLRAGRAELLGGLRRRPEGRAISTLLYYY